MKLIKKKKGFTIVELVIVIGVIGVLAGILIPTFVNVRQQAEAAALKSDLANAYSAYVADAADGKIDDEIAKDVVVGWASGKVYTIELKEQNKVVLKKGDKTYKFKTDGWAEEAVEVTVNPDSVGYNATDSERVEVKYGTYSVYFKD